MIKELKIVFFIIVIFFFLGFTSRYYFSDENKKNMYRSSIDIDNKIENFSQTLDVLKNNTNDIIKYTDNVNNKDQKKYFFWKLLNTND